MNPSTVVRRLLDLALVLLIGLALVALVLGRVLPMIGHPTLVVAGASMDPTIPLGSAVVTEPVAAADLRAGDVVSLRTGPDLGTVFTHRIIRLVALPDGLWVETKGDANATVDPVLTPATHVTGRVVAFVPVAGYLLRFLSLPSGLAALGCLLATIVLSSWFLDTLRRERQVRAENRALAVGTSAGPGPAIDAPSGDDPGHETAGRPGQRGSSRRGEARGRRRPADRMRYAMPPRSAAAVWLQGR